MIRNTRQTQTPWTAVQSVGAGFGQGSGYGNSAHWSSANPQDGNDRPADGDGVLAGLASSVFKASSLLVIGGGGGSICSGLGAMTVGQIGFDATPFFDTLAPVPEPQTRALMGLGLAVVR